MVMPVWWVMCYVAIVTKITGVYVAMCLISCYSLRCNVCIWGETVPFSLLHTQYMGWCTQNINIERTMGMFHKRLKMFIIKCSYNVFDINPFINTTFSEGFSIQHNLETRFFFRIYLNYNTGILLFQTTLTILQSHTLLRLDCLMVQTLWKTLQQFHNILNIIYFSNLPMVKQVYSQISREVRT